MNDNVNENLSVIRVKKKKINNEPDEIFEEKRFKILFL